MSIFKPFLICFSLGPGVLEWERKSSLPQLGGQPGFRKTLSMQEQFRGVENGVDFSAEDHEYQETGRKNMGMQGGVVKGTQNEGCKEQDR